MKKRELIIPLVFTLILFTIVLTPSLVSALNGFGGGLGSILPGDLLDNPWFVFTGIFVLMMGLIYFSLLKVFTRSAKKEQFGFEWHEKSIHKMPLILISTVISLFISAALTQQAMLYGFLGDVIVKWILIIILIAVLLAAFVAAMKGGFNWVMGLLVFLWILINLIDPWDFLPSSILSATFDEWYNLFRSIPVGVGLIAIWIIATFLKKKQGLDETTGQPRKFGFGTLFKIILSVAVIIAAYYVAGIYGIVAVLALLIVIWLLTKWMGSRRGLGPGSTGKKSPLGTIIMLLLALGLIAAGYYALGFIGVGIAVVIILIVLFLRSKIKRRERMESSGTAGPTWYETRRQKREEGAPARQQRREQRAQDRAQKSQERAQRREQSRQERAERKTQRGIEKKRQERIKSKAERKAERKAAEEEANKRLGERQLQERKNKLAQMRADRAAKPQIEAEERRRKERLAKKQEQEQAAEAARKKQIADAEKYKLQEHRRKAGEQMLLEKKRRQEAEERRKKQEQEEQAKNKALVEEYQRKKQLAARLEQQERQKEIDAQKAALEKQRALERQKEKTRQRTIQNRQKTFAAQQAKGRAARGGRFPS